MDSDAASKKPAIVPLLHPGGGAEAGVVLTCYTPAVCTQHWLYTRLAPHSSTGHHTTVARPRNYPPQCSSSRL